MNDSVSIWETPAAREPVLIAGWHQWADAGNVSSGLPAYLVRDTGAQRIGEIKSDSFYLFQVPGTHHFLRPEVELSQGMIQGLEPRSNDFYLAGDVQPRLVLFLGQEPHLNAEAYVEAFLDAAQALGVTQIVVLGGVYGALPYDRDRRMSCVFSLESMRDDLSELAVQFSDYEGGATIGTLVVEQAGQRGMAAVDFYAFVPAYDLGQHSEVVQSMRIEEDYRAWHELMRRINHLLGLGLDLSDLQQRSEDLIRSMDARIEELDRKMPQVKLRAYMEELAEGFEEQPFAPLDDIWEEALGDALDNLDI